MWIQRLVSCAAVVTGVVGLSGCGSSEVAARVGSTAITTADVRHWTAVMSGQAAQALDFLAMANWMLQEAADEHLPSSPHELARRVQEDEAKRIIETEEPGHVTIRTAADVKFEASAEAASSVIRNAVLATVPAVTPAEIETYYGRHRAQYLIPEQRDFDIDNLHSVATALKVKREVEAGRPFAKISGHEELSRGPTGDPGGTAIDKAIFKARMGVLSGPVTLPDYHDHSLFEVTRIVPASYQPLAQVQAAIADQIGGKRRQKALAAFASAWRAKWISRTDCRPRYSAPACRQYKGSRVLEPLFGL